MIHRTHSLIVGFLVLFCCHGCCVADNRSVGSALGMDLLLVQTGDNVRANEGRWPGSIEEIARAAAKLGHPFDPKAFRISFAPQTNGDLIINWSRRDDGFCYTGGQVRLSSVGQTTRPAQGVLECD